MLSKFFDYCLSFYGSGGLYDMGATRDQIEQATAHMLQHLSPAADFCGDSVDRERVRDILIEQFGLVFP